MTPSLAVYMFGFDLDKIRYPYLASIASALELVGPTGAVYYCYCLPMGDDSPARVIREFGDAINDGRLIVLDHDWGSHHTIQSHIANFILNEIGTKFDYALKLDMDEVIHEGSFGDFRSDLEFMDRSGAVLGRPRYIHFSPDFDTTWPFIYPSKAVISRTKDKLRFFTGSRGDACALGGSSEFQTQLICHHYGKVATGREREALYKEVSFQKLYSHPEDGIGFPDERVTRQIEKGYLDYSEVFEVAKANGEFHPFTGTHPIFVQPWIEEMKARSIQFWNEQDNDGA